MLKSKNFPNTFWTETIHTVVYILNRFTKAMFNRTPYEAWH